MASRAGTYATLATNHPAALARRLSQRLVRVTLALFLLLFAVLFIRHRAGMFKRPIPGEGLIALGILLTALFTWFHGTHWNRFKRSRLTLGSCLEWLFPLLLLVLVFLSVTLPGSSRIALIIMWGLIGTSEVAWTTALLIVRRDQRLPAAETSTRKIDRPADDQDSDNNTLSESDVLPDGKLVQQITRSLRAHGGELIVASTQANFESGQRTEIVHLAFCPPLQHAPVIQCNQIDGPPCRIKAAESQVYGARFEIRLLDCFEEPVQVRFEIEATTDPAVP